MRQGGEVWRGGSTTWGILLKLPPKLVLMHGAATENGVSGKDAQMSSCPDFEMGPNGLSQSQRRRAGVVERDVKRTAILGHRNGCDIAQL